MAADTAPADDEPPARMRAERDELERVLASPAFAGAVAHQRLLRYLVEQLHAGRAAQLKETVLAIEVFQRPAARYDPRRDSIVRVEARRLRERLHEHYAQAPVGPLMLTLPKGSYRPRFVARAVADATARASELVERGLYFLRQGHEEGHRKALQRFEQAVAAAPDLAVAHVGVARAWLQLVATNLEPPRPGVDLALAAVRSALALQPAQGEALVLAAQLTHRFEFDWPAAQALYARAVQEAPGSAYVHHAHAFALMMRGDHAQAEAELATARAIDPMHLGLRAHVALLQIYRRQWRQAEATLQALLDMSADNVLGMSLLAYVALCDGRPEEALAQYALVAQRHAQLSIGPAGVVQALAAAGRDGEAQAALHALEAGWRGRYLSPYQLAMCTLRLGDAPRTLALLARAVDERDPNALCLPVDPAFDALHGSASFQVLRERVLGGPAGDAATGRQADPEADRPCVPGFSAAPPGARRPPAA